MGKYLIKSDDSNTIKKFIKKFNEFSVCNDEVRGKVIINNYRKYSYGEEVDLTFEGEIHVRIHGNIRSWRKSDILKNEQYKISIIKLNRFLRKGIIRDLENYMKFFGVRLRFYDEIKKINWK